MLQYILEVTLCWGLFYTIFFGFLRKLTFFSVNRWYLLGTMVLGILIPLLRYIELDLYQEEIAQTIPVAIAVKELPAQVAITVEEATIAWSSIIYNFLMTLYLIGVSFFGARMLRSIYRIYRLNRDGQHEDQGHAAIVYTDADHLPFSFFRHVYISRQVDLTENFEEVLQHEIAHVRSYHSVDVLLMELIQISFWFNPMVYIYKTALRQTHEYLADEAVLQNTNRKTYGTMLLKQSLSGLEIALTHRFFHSHIKKRINMMYQKKSGRSAWLKYALALPVLLLLTMAFAQQANSNQTYQSYNTALLSTDINFFCDGAKGSVFSAIFLDDTAENRRISNAEGTRFINPEFFKKINTIYDPAKHFTLIINGKKITDKSQISIDFSKDWQTDYFEIISPEYAKKEYDAPNGVVIIKDLDTSNSANAEQDQDFEPKIHVDGNESDFVLGKEQTNVVDHNKALAIWAETMISSDGIDELLHEINTTHNMSQLDIIKNFYQTGIKKYPMVVVDGETKSMSDLYDLEQGQISSLDMITSASAIDKYGSQAEHGAIIIQSFQDDKIYKVVQEMPRFPGCELKTATPSAKKECADQKLLDYIYENLKYPKAAMTDKIEGRVYIQFVIEKDGSISNTKIVRGIGGGCADAAREVIENMNNLYERWIPGKQQGKAVRVLYTLPVTFKMSNNKEPVHVIDGQIVDEATANKLNPNDIEKVTVIKGEDAINKYGAKATNGVVEITLKRKTATPEKDLQLISNESKELKPLIVIDGKVVKHGKYRRFRAR